MNVTVNDGILKITLSESETQLFGLDRVFTDKNETTVGKSLALLLKKAASEADFATEALKFAVELYPLFGGGCEIFYTPEAENVKRAQPKRWSVFEFESSEAMVLACEYIFSEPKARFCASALYKYRRKYRLTVKNLPPLLHRTVSLEYADRVLKNARELGETLGSADVIVPKNAVAVIGSAFGGKPLSQ